MSKKYDNQAASDREWKTCGFDKSQVPCNWPWRVKWL